MPLIVQTYGIFWERKHVYFGERGRGNRGTLLGQTGDNRPEIDFRRQRGIYILYEGTDINLQRVAYIGQVGAGNQRLFGRLKQHTRDHLWNRWTRFSWLGLLRPDDQGNLVELPEAGLGEIAVPVALDQLEAALISLMEPLLNRQGAQWGGATEYFQAVPPDDAGPGA